MLSPLRLRFTAGEITESYGTGVQQQPELNIGEGTMPDDWQNTP